MDNVEVLDEDFIIDNSGSITTVCFSKRVHEKIDQSINRVLVVRLLDWPIGYKAILSRFLTLWKPVGDVQLVHLDNNYYIAKFLNNADYTKAFTEGPWTKYGSYLTVQPWSRSFLTSEKHPSHTIVWVRLPGLPYRYYSKDLFIKIAEAVGTVVKVNYNTQAGGLVNICYSCGIYGYTRENCGKSKDATEGVLSTYNLVERTISRQIFESRGEDLYVPWMVVEKMKRKPKMDERRNARTEKSVGGKKNSIFVALVNENPDGEQENIKVMEGV
ncbi:uncharacterized protein LOC120169330 [Hibiscus syriacus]|uniref:uncharacterized protein LOC120169330 n=1 Tax=Hibiscus syriacus TaxID=106335 RepID=UPI0019214D6C|nr:uncharacterized protein LOC120169330 [Hibiscus syriacus]